MGSEGGVSCLARPIPGKPIGSCQTKPGSFPPSEPIWEDPAATGPAPEAFGAPLRKNPAAPEGDRSRALGIEVGSIAYVSVAQRV